MPKCTIPGSYVCLVLEETDFSREAVPFYIPTKHVWVIQFLHILTIIWWCNFFSLASLIGVQ